MNAWVTAHYCLGKTLDLTTLKIITLTLLKAFMPKIAESF